MKKQDPGPTRILIAPLDWGLGHATRCIPLIRFLLESNCDVWVASEGRVQHLLQQEFPTLTFLPLKGYNIRYANKRGRMLRKIIGQIPGILQTIRYENQWLKEIVVRFHIDAVVSDNRFGLYHDAIPCVYMTHQLLIKVPGGSSAEAAIQWLHYRYINRFKACWVPDFPESPCLSGELGHPTHLPTIPVHYLGPLSRLERKERPETHPLLFLLSGPEPQRTLFEDQILRQLKVSGRSAILVRGLPGEPADLTSEGIMEALQAQGRLVIYNHLPGGPLGALIVSAQWVIARTGYTTVMDLVHLQKRSILVPTPGQPEQEYLGVYLRNEGIAYTISQDEFILEKALKEAGSFSYRFPKHSAGTDYQQVATQWLESIRGH